MGEILTVCTGSTGKAEPPRALPCLGKIRLSPAWKFVLNVYKGSKKGYKTIKATLIPPPGEAGKALPPPPPHNPPFSCLKCLTQLRPRPQESILTAQLHVLEEPIQRENPAGGNSSWRLIQHGSGLWIWAVPIWRMPTIGPWRLLQPWK